MQFNQPDTLIPDLYNPLDWNRYGYTRYNPVKYTDPSGHAVATDTNEAGCNTPGSPKCILDKYGYNEAARDRELRNYIRAYEDYNLVTDSQLTDDEKTIVSIAMFHAAVQDAPKGASLGDIIQATWPSAASLSIFGLITTGMDRSPDDRGGGGWSTGPNWTKKMLSESELIAQGYNIREVDELVRIY